MLRRVELLMALISEMCGLACHMGSHGVTWCQHKWTHPHLNPIQTCHCLIIIPRRDGRLSWP